MVISATDEDPAFRNHHLIAIISAGAALRSPALAE